MHMKLWLQILMIIMIGGLAFWAFAEEEQHENIDKSFSDRPDNAGSSQQNFEVIVQHIDGTESTAWEGQIFSLRDAKPLDAVSPENRYKKLPSGNYILMLIVKEEIPELKAARPFTFSIADDAKTIFTLSIGASQEQEIEYGVGRAGADFIDTDPRRGRDYVNFELPKDQPELCLERCKKDRNCDAYAYSNRPELPKARCWLIHGVAVSYPRQYAISGVIQRDSSPYQVSIITEKFNRED